MERSSVLKLVVAGAAVGAAMGIGGAVAGSAAPVEKAVAVLHPTAGNEVEGKITFTRKEDAVQVSGEITGLTAGEHGFHVHEWGDCGDPKADAAGGHFNPGGKKHGPPNAGERHAGDLGNIEADASGKVKIDATDSVLQLNGDASIVGRAVIVHAKADDLKSQPSGEAGPRLACGVIGVAKPQ